MRTDPAREVLVCPFLPHDDDPLGEIIFYQRSFERLETQTPQPQQCWHHRRSVPPARTMTIEGKKRTIVSGSDSLPVVTTDVVVPCPVSDDLDN